MEEREVNLRDLVFEILLHWRSIIFWMLIGGILLGTLSYIRLQYSDGAQAEKLSLSDLKYRLSQTELAAVDQVLLNEYSCGKWQSYMKSSARMKLDSSRIYQADLIFAVTTGEALENPASVYLDLLSTNDMYRFISDKMKGLTLSDMQELISVIQPGTLFQKQESCSFNIIALAGSKKACRTIPQSVQAYIMSLYDSVADTYGAHQVSILKDTISAHLYSTPCGDVFSPLSSMYLSYFLCILWMTDCDIRTIVPFCTRFPCWAVSRQARNQRHFSMMWISGYPNTGTKKDI